MRIGLNMSLTGAGSVSPLALYALGGATPFFVNDANRAKYLDDLTGNKNLHEVWDNASTGAATCIDADGSLKWGLHNLVDTRLNDGGQWTPTGVTVDTVDTAVELITNGTFDSDTDWTKDPLSGGTSWVISGGSASIDGTQTSASDIFQNISVEAGKTYAIKFDVVVASGSVQVMARKSTWSDADATVITSSGTYTITRTASSVSAPVAFRALGSSVVSIDNVSVLPVISSGTDSAGEKRYLLTEDTANSSHKVRRNVDYLSGKTYTHEYVVKANGRTTCVIALGSSPFSNCRYYFDLEAETATQSVAGTNDSGSIENLGNGEYLCRVTADAEATGSYNYDIRLLGSGSNTYTGDGTSGMYVSQATVYQSSVGPRAELVTNGTFDSDISGWTDTSDAGGAISWNASGYMEVTNTSGTARALQSVTLEAGKTYRASVNIISPPAGGGSVAIQVPGETATTLFDIDELGVGEHVVEYTATADGDHYFTVKQFSVGTSTIDNLSILPVTPQMQKSSKDNSLFLENETGAAKYALRVDHSNGVPEVLAEPAGTNINPYLGARTNVGGWFNQSATITQLTGNYLGAFSGVRVASNGATWHGLQIQEVSATSGVKVAFTAAFAEGTSGKARVSVRNATAATESLVQGTIGSLAVGAQDFGPITDVKEWTAGSVTFVSFVLTPNSTTSRLSVRISPDSAIVGKDIIALAAQVETNHAPTSLIPTSGAAATRTKDEPTRGLPDGFIQGEGSIYFEGSLDYETGGSNYPRLFQIDDGTNNNRVNIGCSEAAGNITFFVSTGGVQQASFIKGVSSGQLSKVVARYNDDDFAASFDGNSTQTDTSGTLSTNITTVRIGDVGGILRTVRIRDLRLFPYSSPSATPGWSDAILEEISGA